MGNFVTPRFLWRFNDAVGAIPAGSNTVPDEDGAADGNDILSTGSPTIVAGGVQGNYLQLSGSGASQGIIFPPPGVRIDANALKNGLTLDFFVRIPNIGTRLKIGAYDGSTLTNEFFSVTVEIDAASNATASLSLVGNTGDPPVVVTTSIGISVGNWYHARFGISKSYVQTRRMIAVGGTLYELSTVSFSGVLPQMFRGASDGKIVFSARVEDAGGIAPFSVDLDNLAVLDAFDEGDNNVPGVVVPTTFSTGGDPIYELTDGTQELGFRLESVEPLLLWTFNDTPPMPSGSPDIPAEVGYSHHTARENRDGNAFLSSVEISNDSPRFGSGCLRLTPNPSALLRLPHPNNRLTLAPSIGNGISLDFLVRFKAQQLDQGQTVLVYLNATNGTQLLTISLSRVYWSFQVVSGNRTFLKSGTIDPELTLDDWHNFRIGVLRSNSGVVTMHIDGVERARESFVSLNTPDIALANEITLTILAIKTLPDTEYIDIDRLSVIPYVQFGDYNPSNSENVIGISGSTPPFVFVDPTDLVLELGDVASIQLNAANAVPPLTWVLLDGVLPPGLSFDASLGAISGIASGLGEYAFEVQVIDSEGKTSPRTRFRISVAHTPYGKLSFGFGGFFGTVPNNSPTVPADVLGNMDGNAQASSVTIAPAALGHSGITGVLRLFAE